MGQRGLYRNYIKRLLDIILSVLAMIVLSPVLLITALLVRVKLGSPVLFRQARPGMNEKIFQLYKFRSMTNETGPDGRLLPDTQRLTKLGRILRSTSLDELPELINIFKGDMSIVGPRPLSVYYLPHYPRQIRRRQDVRPGLTGLAQVNGRNNLPWEERFAYDMDYVDHVSLGMDLRILWQTVLKVVKRADVAVRGTTKVIDYGPYSVLKEEGHLTERTDDMTYSEIGSYFWLDGSENKAADGDFSWLPNAEDSAFTFSGRNAIDIALRDILKSRPVRTVYAPSYCCISMLQAFIDRGMEVRFYDVSVEDGRFVCQMPNAGSDSVVLAMSYFGLDAAPVHEMIRKLHEKGVVVMEDVTHSLLRENCAAPQSDYLVASLRKWFAAPAGGWVGKTAGELAEKPNLDSNHATTEKIAAMREKYDYLSGKMGDKEHFLLAQAKFDNDLIHVDRLLKIDDTSLQVLAGADIPQIIDRRRANAAALLEGLKGLEDVCTLPQVDLTRDVPLFVPVFLKREDRDSLRRCLIAQGIYCPVHWPEVMGAPAGIRENELSLICDQRYNEGDMDAIVSAIRQWYQDEKKNG